MIRVHAVLFPWAEAGLPEGCEKADQIPKGQNLDMRSLCVCARDNAAADGGGRLQAEKLLALQEKCPIVIHILANVERVHSHNIFSFSIVWSSAMKATILHQL
ncbi:unnamed protein product [Cuscuta campestris]|uniref:Uncharacterized protein n=1 Tax=Cuscuta campestris TaxID=132261 RepID=A0A484MSR4_9ASTE|nr:unnamed protein product [Cuscuta campestris]